VQAESLQQGKARHDIDRAVASSSRIEHAEEVDTDDNGFK